MEIYYTLTEDDYMNFNLYHVKNSSTAKKALKIQRLMGPFLYLFFTVLLYLYIDIPSPVLVILFLVLSSLWLFLYPRYFYNHILRSTKKMIKEGANDGLLGEHHMILSDDGIIDLSSNRETKVQWSGVQLFKEDDDNLYLYNSSISAYILPKRDLKETDEVRGFILSKMS